LYEKLKKYFMQDTFFTFERKRFTILAIVQIRQWFEPFAAT
jgi:hypothetical protein